LEIRFYREVDGRIPDPKTVKPGFQYGVLSTEVEVAASCESDGSRSTIEARVPGSCSTRKKIVTQGHPVTVSVNDRPFLTATHK